MSAELYFTPPHSLAQLPVLVPPPVPLPPTWTTKDFLLTFPPHAATILRSHRHRISQHQRRFHARRLQRSAAHFLPPGAELTEAEVARRLDDLCDALLTALKPPPQAELILSVLCVNAQAGGSCFAVHGRYTSPFPQVAPLVTCLLQPTPERYLATHKHSQWIRDRAPLEALKQQHECGELIMCDEQGTEVREGLITCVLVEEGGRVKGCPHGKRLPGYFEHVLQGEAAGGEGDGTTAVTADGLKEGRYDSVFVTGSAICIAAVSGVKWLPDASNGANGGGGASQPCGAKQYSEASVRRVEAIRQRMLATLDQHLAEDDERSQQAANGK